jgi:hypothetical protein
MHAPRPPKRHYRPDPERHGPEGGAVIVALLATVAGLVALLVWLILSPRAEVINFDPGGSITVRVAQIEAGAAPVIAGHCYSSCTMHLTGGCFMPEAVLLFHAPTGPRGEPLSPEREAHWRRVMARYYPPAIARWFLDATPGTYTMTGAEAIRLGARAC